MSLPRVTVVTVVRNGVDTIERTLESVLSQDYPDLEYLIVDGASTDGTLDVIRRHADRVTGITSGRDDGPYDAMNRGTDLATGEWIVFMNGGDVFASRDAVSRVFMTIDAASCDVIYGDGVIHGPGYRRIERAADPPTLTDGNGFSHQSAFVRTTLQKTFRFDTNERIAADYDLFLRLHQAGKIFRHANVVVSEFFMGGVSTIGRIETLKLRHRIYKKYRARSDAMLYMRIALYGAKLGIRSMVPSSLWERMKRFRHRQAPLSLDER